MTTIACPWTPETIDAYCAAFIDSDGSIGYSRYGPTTYVLRLSVYNNNPEPLHFLQEHYGGTLHFRERQTKTVLMRQYTVVWHAKKADPVLHRIAPYVVAKRDQVALAIKIRAQTAADGFNSHADKAWRHEAYEQMKMLNTRWRGGWAP